jgi:hypothetical protein
MAGCIANKTVAIIGGIFYYLFTFSHCTSPHHHSFHFTLLSLPSPKNRSPLLLLFSFQNITLSLLLIYLFFNIFILSAGGIAGMSTAARLQVSISSSLPFLSLVSTSYRPRYQLFTFPLLSLLGHGNSNSSD